MKSDTFRIYLCSEDNTTEDEANGTYTFNIRLPAKKNTYTGYTLYVDDFNVCLKGLSITSVLVKMNMGEYNSYNSQTGANNNTIATMFPSSQTSGRTDDLSILYQASTTPYNITSLPEVMNIRLTNIDNTGIDFSSANNFWTLNMRIVAHEPCD
tara:strand:+ start:903 stop:1364 length:462 start_codon:yes stop_codon:yes gene_type:complete